MYGALRSREQSIKERCWYYRGVSKEGFDYKESCCQILMLKILKTNGLQNFKCGPDTTILTLTCINL